MNFDESIFLFKKHPLVTYLESRHLYHNNIFFVNKHPLVTYLESKHLYHNNVIINVSLYLKKLVS